MSYRYKQSDARDANLLDAEQIQAGLVEQIGSVQALDRDQLPHDSVAENNIANGALHQMLSADMNSENAAPYRFTNPADRNAQFNFLPNFYFPPALQYKNYSGGCVVLCSEDIVCTGGIIQAEFSCWVWRETVTDAYNTNEVPNRYYLRLLVNDRVIADSGPIASNWSNIHLVGTGVAPEGATRVTVEYKVTPMDGDANFALVAPNEDLPVFCVGGTALLIQNRRA